MFSTHPVIGAYNLELPPLLLKLALFAWGEEVVDAVCNHASHHTVGQWSVCTDKLPDHWAEGPFTVTKN